VLFRSLRIVIIIVAGFLIWEFSDAFSLSWETLPEPFGIFASMIPPRYA